MANLFCIPYRTRYVTNARREFFGGNYGSKQITAVHISIINFVLYTTITLVIDKKDNQ